MQTDVNTKRYMVSKTGSRMAVNSYSMLIFDHLSDAIAQAQVYRTDWVYELSPVDKPRKITVHKYLKGLL